MGSPLAPSHLQASCNNLRNHSGERVDPTQPTSDRNGPTIFRSGRIWYYEWRWRESNPRPSVMGQGFSGRSLLIAFSVPALTQACRRRTQSLFNFPTGPATGSIGGVSLRCQTPVRRRYRADRVRSSLRRRGRTRTASCWQLLVCCHRINEVTTATLDPLPLARTTEVEAGHPHVELSKQASRGTSAR